MTCPHCQEPARFKGYRNKRLVSALGPLDVEWGYYHCPHCHQGHCPIDDVLGLDCTDLTSGAAELTTLAGTLESFARASAVILPKLCGLRLAESTVERTTETIGAELGRAIEAKVSFDAATSWDWHKDAEGATCAYVSIDATGVGRQGPGGVAAEGEMIAVGMVYNPVPEDRAQWANPQGRRPSFQARYVASIEGQEAVAEPLRHQTGRVGMGEARRWIAISDGGAGLEGLFRSYFGRVDEVILDFFHASEYLGDFAKAWCPGDSDAAREAHEDWARRLKHEGGAAMLEWLEGLDVEARPQARPAWETIVTYFRNQHKRMDYPRYLAKGWQIGSGPVEAGCKLVVGQRMKGPGMRWGHEGAGAVCHLRALLLSDEGQWEAYWADCRAAPIKVAA
jgi:hypothetical protein